MSWDGADSHPVWHFATVVSSGSGTIKCTSILRVWYQEGVDTGAGKVATWRNVSKCRPVHYGGVVYSDSVLRADSFHPNPPFFSACALHPSNAHARYRNRGL